MNNYEIMYVMRPEQEIVEDVILKFNDLIASNGGVVERQNAGEKEKCPMQFRTMRMAFMSWLRFVQVRSVCLSFTKKWILPKKCSGI